VLDDFETDDDRELSVRVGVVKEVYDLLDGNPKSEADPLDLLADEEGISCGILVATGFRCVDLKKCCKAGLKGAGSW
jgi:hypothetical protein